MYTLRPATILFLLLATTLLAACGGGGGGDGNNGGGGADTDRPRIASTFPEDGQVVAPPGLVYVQFDVPLDASSIDIDQIQCSSLGVPVPGETAYNAAQRRVVFTPDSTIARGVPVRALLRAGVADLEENVRTAPYTFEFRIAERAFGLAFNPEPVVDTSELLSAAHNGTNLAGFVTKVSTGTGTGDLYVTTIEDYRASPRLRFITNGGNMSVDKDQGLAISPAKDVAVVWTDFSNSNRDAYFRYQAQGGSWHAIQDIEGAADRATGVPLVQVDDAGNAVVAWQEGDTTSTLNDVFVAFYTRAGDYYGPFPVESSDGLVKNLRFSMNGDGRGIVTWAQKTSAYYDVWAITLNMQDGVGARRLVESYDDDDAYPEQVWMSRTGEAVGVYTESDPNDTAQSGRLRGMRYLSGGTWDTPILGSAALRRRVSMPSEDGSGKVHFAWLGATGSFFDSIGYTSLSSDGAWTGVGSVAPSLTDNAQFLELDAHADGTRALSWTSRNPENSFSLRALVTRPDGVTLGPVEVARGANGGFVAHGVGCEPGGGAHFLYNPNPSYAPGNHVVSRALRPDGTFSDPVALDSPSERTAGPYRVMINTQGLGFAVWAITIQNGPNELSGAFLR